MNNNPMMMPVGGIPVMMPTGMEMGFRNDTNGRGILSHLKAHIHKGEDNIVAEGNKAACLLGGHDSSDACATKGISLGKGILLKEGHGLGGKRDNGFCKRFALSPCFCADINHLDCSVRSNMGEALLHANLSIGGKDFAV